jgi:hypothetical protein
MLIKAVGVFLDKHASLLRIKREVTVEKSFIILDPALILDLLLAIAIFFEKQIGE